MTVQLIGGAASGLLVPVARFHDRIEVYQNSGRPFAVASRLTASEPGARFLGAYELVEPIGPEKPVYVAV